MAGVCKTALITGIHGFTGCYMQAELQAAGYRVVGLGAHPSCADDYWQADLLDRAALHGALREIQPDVIVHLAAVAFVGHLDASAFYEINLLGTRNLLEAIIATGKVPTCVLLASSANIYGNASEGLLDEGALVAPVNDYAVSKLAMEYMARLYSSKLPLVLARPFNYTGVGQANNFLIPKIVAHFRSGAPVIELGNLDVWRDFCDVRSVVQAYRRLLEAPAAYGETVNVCSGHAYSLREVIDLCRYITGRSIEIRISPEFIRTNEVKVLCGDNSRLLSLLGNWTPLPLKETLCWMLDSPI